MRVLRHFSPIPDPLRGAVYALGNFDGVHLGHQAVIARAAAIARAEGRPLGVLTFEPHPRQVFRPDDPPFRLTPFRVKVHAFEGLGLDLMVCLHFDAEFASHSAEDFARTVLGEGLAAGHVVVGYDFSYGHARRGNPEVLTASGQELGFGVTIVAPEATAGGAIYSSTKIRDHLQAGEPRAAASLLGRDWEIDGRVEHGDARGRTIGFPTANLDLGEYLRPRPGVYAVRVGIDRAGSVMWHQGVANLGTRPTVAGTDLRFEVHLLDFTGDLYGQLLRVAFVEWIRGEQKFAGLDALKAQIALDAARAREMLTP